MSSYTAEQSLIIEKSRSFKSASVQAGAGCGKTFSIIGVIQNNPNSRCLYLAFNKAMAQEAQQKFRKHKLSNAKAMTGHGLAFRSLGSQYSHKLNERPVGSMLAEAIGCVPFELDDMYLSASDVAIEAFSWVTKFQHSADPTLGPKSIPNHFAGLFGRDESVLKSGILHLMPVAREIWKRMSDPDDPLPCTPDTVLKMFQLSRPKLNSDLLLVDESQDSNPVLIDLVEMQSHARKLWVGDPMQQLYSFRNAVNAFEHIDTQAHFSLTQSFRFGPAIADLGTEVIQCFYQRSDWRLHGLEVLDSRVSFGRDRGAFEFDAVLYRNNADLLADLISCEEQGIRAYVNGGIQDEYYLILGILQLMSGKRSTIKELRSFRTFKEFYRYVESPLGSDMKKLLLLIVTHIGEDSVVVEDKTRKRSAGQQQALGRSGISHMLEILRSVSKRKPREAEIVLSTAHKAKGDEWPSVRLADGFKNPWLINDLGKMPQPDDGEEGRPDLLVRDFFETAGSCRSGQERLKEVLDLGLWSLEEANCLYVAITRATDYLDVSEIANFLEQIRNFRRHTVA